ncbi:Cytoskeletal signaling protein slm1 [Choanephora cucurbitarum]|uniref:Cytoskeletal signaling protein slm1 n=1 Tax=Choanephora cucurbitarum TaxID=101091 RepID=A0A1C7NNJ5_9FUNG|nr:Cytoskeletal signaling protein slm1 [Choanephora cucurbitarum]
MSSILSKKQWARGQRSNAISPLKVSASQLEKLETSFNPSSCATTAIGSPSSVKVLFPSISIFNLPTMLQSTPPLPSYSSTNLASPSACYSPTTSNHKLVSPPPQFAIEHNYRRFLKRPRWRKRSIRKGYPSAFKTFLFDDVAPGTLSQGIRPVRLLIERLEAWHLLSKRLFQYFEIVGSIETRVAKKYRKLENAMVFPTNGQHVHYRKSFRKPLRIRQRRRCLLHKDNQLLQMHFSFQGGIRSICEAWQRYHANTARDHADLATFLRNEAIPTLSNIKRELKWMIKAIRNDGRLSLVHLTNMKGKAARRLKQLDRQLVFFDQHPYHGHMKKDPWLMNAAVVKQMVKVYNQENKMHETVLRLQRETLISEEHLIEELRRLCQQIQQMQDQSSLGVDRGIQAITSAFEKVRMDSDWCNFQKQHEEQLVSETAAFRHPDHLQYPNHTHVLLQPVFAAHMERRSRIFRNWHEYIYVLTPAGFLHEYRKSSHYPGKPDATIFVPHYKVSSLATNLHHNLIFQLQPHTASRNLLQSHHNALPKQWFTSKQRWGLCDRMTWTLRAKSAADMEAWLFHLTESSERYRPIALDVLSGRLPNTISKPKLEAPGERNQIVSLQESDINVAEEETHKTLAPSIEDDPIEEEKLIVEDVPSAEDASPVEDTPPVEDAPPIEDISPTESKSEEEVLSATKSEDSKEVSETATEE